MAKKILICGSSGFIGNNIVNYLLNNTDYELYLVSNKNYTLQPPHDRIKKSFSSADLTTQYGINHIFCDNNYDVIVQAAASTSGAKDTIERPYIHVTDNVIMNSLLLRAAYEHNVKQFIFLSCTVMYQSGDVAVKESDFNESDTIFPSYFGVGSMKVYIEKQMQFYSTLGRTKHISIRHSNTYGPYDKYDYEHSHVFGATIRKVMDATDTIEVWGTGEETVRDLIYVEDVCSFIDKAIKHQSSPFDIVNVSYGKSVTIKELVEKIVAASGKKLKITYNVNKPIIPTKLSVDCTKARTFYNWQPNTNIDDGILKTLEWYNKYYNKG